ncbi:O-methyltransferase-domain-containing protein [Mycena alexandri]|uniref:O-methyltransferase-domain-containing protein n=1 Tax=Mycena alexandri TaxID=1745969 RepID=A0AAD6X432_9AGAR|nr:O-methyltransferase-domain-containing protein [Mycena alexandri]
MPYVYFVITVPRDARHILALLNKASSASSQLASIGGLHRVRYEIAVSAALGKFLQSQLLAIKAKRVLEVGSLGGYSAIWMARALPGDGELVALEVEKLHAEVIEENVRNAGLSSKVKVILGLAHESMKAMPSSESFDLVFIDADKPNSTSYFIEAKRLLRKGGIIIVDNVGRGGQLADESNSDEMLDGVRALLRHITQT